MRSKLSTAQCIVVLLFFLLDPTESFNSSSSSTSALSSFSSSSFSASNYSSSSSSTGTDADIGGASAGLIIYGVICFLGVMAFTSYLLNRYARPGCPPAALFLTWLSWLITFSICFLVPIDLLPGVSTSLDSVWSTLYWCQFLLMWIVIPFASGYYDNGGFTFRQRCVASLRFNAVLGLVVGIIGGAGFVYLIAAAKWSTSDVAGAAICASTVWGLIMLVVSGGWGLIEVPRALHNYTSTERRKNRIYFDAASIHHEAAEARDELVATINLLRLLEPRLYAKVQGLKAPDESKQGPGKPRRRPVDLEDEEEHVGDGDESDALSSPKGGSSQSLHALHFSYFKQILALVKEWEVQLASLTAHPHPFDLPFKQSLIAASLTKKSLSLSQLTALHYHVITASKKLTLCETQWRDTVDAAVRLERDIENQNSNDQASWYLRTGRAKLAYAAYIASIVLSILILFCELTVPAGASVSPLGLLVTSTKGFFLSEQIFTAVPLVYLSICAYSPLFQLKLGNLYYLGRHRTDESTLLLNCTLLLRMSVPLAYNVILLLNQTAGSLTAFIGTVQVIPFFGSTQFNTIFPVFMVAIALLVLSRVISYLLVCLNVKSLKFDLVRKSSDDPEIADLMDEGKTLIANELKKRQKESGKASTQTERTVVDGLADRVKAKLADRNARRDKESAEVRERIVELGSNRSAERRHRSDELQGAMGEGLDTEGWRRENQAESSGTSQNAFYKDPAAGAIRAGLMDEKGGGSEEYEGGEDQMGLGGEDERQFDEEGYDQDGLDINGYDKWGGYWSAPHAHTAADTHRTPHHTLTAFSPPLSLPLSALRRDENGEYVEGEAQ